MSVPMSSPVRDSSLRVLRYLSVAAVALAPLVATQATAQQPQLRMSRPITVGQKYVMATHSFNVFIGPNRVTGDPGPLAALVLESGVTGHENLAVQMIGGSTPMQHWNQGDGDDSKNIAKVALRAGGVNVLTMSPNATIPEQGIDLFGDLMIETNPNGRILVQHSWSAWDGYGRTPSVGGNGGGDFTNADRDKTDLATIQGWIDAAHGRGGYLERLRDQLDGINRRAGHTMAFVVPSGTAVYRLRQEVLKGNVPGIERQSQLFLDPIGHGARPVTNLVTYVWFTTMYRQPAMGLVALVDPDDPTSLARERLLQRLAWDVVMAEPMSGLTEHRMPGHHH